MRKRPRRLRRPGRIELIAPAKVNLALHVVGRRPDGLHLLDSLAAFTEFGDLVEARLGAGRSIEVEGPMAQGVPADETNLAMRAAALFDRAEGCRVRIDKRIPAAAGLGGGSADAAAALRLLSRAGGWSIPGAREVGSLGSDVPACLFGRTVRVRGAGEMLDGVDRLPGFPLVLANPRRRLPTAAVYGALRSEGRSGLAPFPDGGARESWVRWISAQRNDLEEPALRLCPEIGQALQAVGASAGCKVARMTGSGPTCFGIFGGREEADAAADRIRAEHPGWWAVSTRIRTGGDSLRADQGPADGSAER